MSRRIGFVAMMALLAVSAGPRAGWARDRVTIAPAPAGEQLSDDFEVNVEGQAVPVFRCRVSAVPLNQVWPGYQRPLDQTELASFACWDMTGAAEVQVRSRRPVQTVAVRPASLGIKPVVSGDTITFRPPRPGFATVEVNGPHRALHLFASPPEKDAPRPTDPGVRYFGPGVHRPGKIVLGSNETLYVAGGAVVYGAVQARGASHIRVLGRGIIDASGFERGQGGGIVRLADCSDIVIDGVVMRDPDVWCCSLFGCRNARIANVKLVGLWRYNADGIDLCNSREITVRDCFVRAFDDCIVLKGLKGRTDFFDARPVQNVDVRGCVIWNDWGRALEIGAETCAPEIAHVMFRDCDIIRTVHIAMDIQHGDRAAVHDIRFENIRVEIDDAPPPPRMQRVKDEKYVPDPKLSYCPNLVVVHVTKTFYSKDDQRGTVRNVVFKDITATGRPSPASYLRGFDAAHGVEGLVFENVRINNRPVTDPSAGRIAIGPHVRDVKFIVPGSSPSSNE
jgi:Glycosyl hydrolases family 28